MGRTGSAAPICRNFLHSGSGDAWTEPSGFSYLFEYQCLIGAANILAEIGMNFAKPKHHVLGVQKATMGSIGNLTRDACCPPVKGMAGSVATRPVLSSLETVDTEAWLRALLTDRDPLDIEDFFPLDEWQACG